MRSRRLVIDASVAATTGEPNERGDACRTFLDTTLAHKHRLVMTEAIYLEWKQHQGKWSRGWLAKMTSSKLVVTLLVEEEAALRKALNEALTSNTDREAVAKDTHLIEAAMATDRIIASCDEKARKPLHIAAAQVKSLRSLIWVNLANEGEDCSGWLRQGAPARAERKLGYKGK